ncbi:MAG: electron transfer flavoprotein subunit alpha/FixB family protein [Chloroflexota bacterium]|nr:electron transfer flavoprotein subunit alpha/FixB family protein [Chloroflexota bacterium]
MSNENGILVIAESTSEGEFKPATAELLTAASGLAKDLNEPVSVALIGSGVSNRSDDAIALGADKVYVIDDSVFENYLNETYTVAVAQVAEQVNPRIILLGHTPNGRELGPSVAVKLETGIATDTTSLDIVDGKLEATRSLSGGLFRQKTGFPKFPNIATVHPKSFDGAEPDSSRSGETETVSVNVASGDLRSRFVSHTEAISEGIKLEDAKVIICGGRGMGSKEGFDGLYELTGLIGESAVGSTRAASDSEFCGQELMIGITGKVVSPDVYFAIALSGASQHMAGCSGSKNIIAINKDPEANIFKESQFGVIGDYQAVIPAFLDELKKLD